MVKRPEACSVKGSVRVEKDVQNVVVWWIRRRREGSPCNYNLDCESVKLLRGHDFGVSCVCCRLRHDLEVLVQGTVCARSRTMKSNCVVTETVLNVLEEGKGIERYLRHSSVCRTCPCW